MLFLGRLVGVEEMPSSTLDIDVSPRTMTMVEPSDSSSASSLALFPHVGGRLLAFGFVGVLKMVLSLLNTDIDIGPGATALVRSSSSA